MDTGKIDYADMSKKTEYGDRSGMGASRGDKTKTEGIGTTDTGNGYKGQVKDTKFKSVADASGWGR